MARKKSAPTEVKERAELIVSREEAARKIKARLEIGQTLLGREANSRETYNGLSSEYSKWNAFNTELLNQLFTTDQLSKEYSFWGVMSIPMNPSLSDDIARVRSNIQGKINRLDSILARLELFPVKGAQVEETGRASSEPLSSRKVFIVHGHDDRAKTNLEVFLHEIGLEPVVLHRQADQGQTIIEKFEKHSDVGYAFVLLTPDEVAYPSAHASRPESERNSELRARPNVIFEFGFFVAKLGRSRVCCLLTGDVSVPSDLSGFIYKRYKDSVEEVAYGITKDLKAAGYTIA